MARKKKWTRTGWMGKLEEGESPFQPFDWEGDQLIVFPRKGRPRQWCPDDWPPVKVRVTVEVIE